MIESMLTFMVIVVITFLMITVALLAISFVDKCIDALTKPFERPTRILDSSELDKAHNEETHNKETYAEETYDLDDIFKQDKLIDDL